MPCLCTDAADPQQPRSAISGDPAKYRDPVTGEPYASVEEYKELQAAGDTNMD